MLDAYVDLHFSSLSFREALAPEMVPSTQYAMASSVKVRKTALGTVTYRSTEAKSQAKGTSISSFVFGGALPLIFEPKYMNCGFFSQRSSDF